MDKKVGYKSAFQFFRVVCQLRLIERKRLNIDMWRAIKKMLRNK